MGMQGVVSQNINTMAYSREFTNHSISYEVKERVQEDPSYVLTVQERTVMNAIDKLNEKLDVSNKELKFSIHEKTKQVMVKLMDKTTNQVIREIPPEKIVDMVATMCENAGLFMDEFI